MTYLSMKQKMSLFFCLSSAITFWTFYSLVSGQEPNLRTSCCEQLNFEKMYVNSLTKDLKNFNNCENLRDYIENL